jgi:hypothetical protein
MAEVCCVWSRYYMNMVNVALLGEIVGNKEAAEMGYRLIDDWLQYEQIADLRKYLP